MNGITSPPSCSPTPPGRASRDSSPLAHPRLGLRLQRRVDGTEDPELRAGYDAFLALQVPLLVVNVAEQHGLHI